jgi:hypothetical protein
MVVVASIRWLAAPKEAVGVMRDITNNSNATFFIDPSPFLFALIYALAAFHVSIAPTLQYASTAEAETLHALSGRNWRLGMVFQLCTFQLPSGWRQAVP